VRSLTVLLVPRQRPYTRRAVDRLESERVMQQSMLPLGLGTFLILPEIEVFFSKLLAIS